MSNDQEVLFEEISGKGGNIGVITLNRPKALNSLTHDMIHAMHAQLKLWAAAAHIKAVVIRAADGRAFCAGGDLRLTYDRRLANDPLLTQYFYDEYQLNRFIFHFPKPYIALLDGITMGGGVGVSIHGSHRIATERLLFAMPETGIGFFPDVGGTYFLPRLPGKIGFYLGLTGEKLASDDCVALGICQQKVAQEAIPELLHALAQHPLGNHSRMAVTQIIDQFKTNIKPSSLLEQQSIIDKCFTANTIEEITTSLQQSNNERCKEAAVMFTKKSPSSLKVTLKALQEGIQLDFDACMRQEYRLTCRFLQGHDFFEGIRALIIDKDQNPQWIPDSLEKISINEVNEYFSPLTKELV